MLQLAYFFVGIIVAVLHATLSPDGNKLITHPEFDITNGAHLEELLAFSIVPLFCGIIAALVNRDIFGKAFMWTIVIVSIIGLILPELNNLLDKK